MTFVAIEGHIRVLGIHSGVILFRVSHITPQQFLENVYYQFCWARGHNWETIEFSGKSHREDESVCH